MRDNIAAEWDDPELRRAKPRKLLRQILASSADKPVIGFKYHLEPDQFTDEILALGSAVRKLLLIRANSLAAYASDKVADATGQGTARKNAVVKKATVPFDPPEFTKFAEKRNRLYAHARQRVRRPCLEIEYTVARTPDGLAEIGRFLDVEPLGFGSPPTVKRNSDDIVSRFSNPDLVQDYLKEHALEHWARES